MCDVESSGVAVADGLAVCCHNGVAASMSVESAYGAIG